jgi:diaminohydroxyphosphoribosylaminopyrimidine deaminase / 5-amino-6-(5-phosphoribosylamino)uracil reductase
MNTSAWSADDYRFMSIALRLASERIHTTSPNPNVGCVLVKANEIIGQGAHIRAGEAHAEVNALKDATRENSEKIAGSTAYVTLEPCAHFGKTPPCADALIQARIARVVIAMQDPNPLVAGKGIQKMLAAGIQVECGLMQTEAEALNPGFITRMRLKRPFIRVKIAASLDAKTALKNGQSRWITSEASRQDVQRWRMRSCAILTGIGTVIADDPQMNIRIPHDRAPLNVIVDSRLRIPENSNILNNSRVLIAHTSNDENRINKLLAKGVDLFETKQGQSVCLESLFNHLASIGINEVLVEAGSTLNGALLNAKLIDEFLIYFAPVLMGGNAIEMFSLPVLSDMGDAIRLKLIETTSIGPDIRIRARLTSP